MKAAVFIMLALLVAVASAENGCKSSSKDLAVEVREAEGEVDDVKAAIKKAANDAKRLSASVEASSRVLKQTTKQSKDAKARIEREIELINRLLKIIKTLHKKHSDEKSQIATLLKALLKKLEGELEKYKTNARTAKNKYDALAAKLDAAKKDVVDEKANLVKAKKELSGIKEHLRLCKVHEKGVAQCLAKTKALAKLAEKESAEADELKADLKSKRAKQAKAAKADDEALDKKEALEGKLRAKAAKCAVELEKLNKASARNAKEQAIMRKMISMAKLIRTKYGNGILTAIEKALVNLQGEKLSSDYKDCKKAEGTATKKVAAAATKLKSTNTEKARLARLVKEAAKMYKSAKKEADSVSSDLKSNKKKCAKLQS